MNTDRLIADVEQYIRSEAEDASEFYNVDWDNVSDYISNVIDAVGGLPMDKRGNTVLWSDHPVAKLMEMDEPCYDWADVLNEYGNRSKKEFLEFRTEFIRMVSDNGREFARAV
jgi:hypothetical protein